VILINNYSFIIYIRSIFFGPKDTKKISSQRALPAGSVDMKGSIRSQNPFCDDTNHIYLCIKTAEI